MDIERTCLEILLRQVYFEWVAPGSSAGEDDYRGLTKKRFLRLARGYLRYATEDENEQMYNWLQVKLKEENGIFTFIRQMSERFLQLSEEGICYRAEEKQFFHWKELVTGLGLELFTMSFLAGRSLCEELSEKQEADCICMPFPKLKHSELGSLLGNDGEGLAENHFHLKGSFPVFLLNWSCLMNHIGDPNDFLHGFQEYQEGELVFREEDRGRKGLYVSVIQAAAYRICLFECYEKIPRKERLEISDGREYDESDLRRIQIQIDSYRGLTEDSFSEKGRVACPDYALYGIWEICRFRDEMPVAGEKYFLYRCFRAVYSGIFGDREKNLFYRYLLIALRFRSEMVQTNRKRGFANFLTYQDRKEDIIDFYKEDYEKYVMRLTACSLQKHQNLASMELRISPKPRAEDTLRRIRFYDENILEGFEKEDDRAKGLSRCFYVLHFPKKREEKIRELEPRDAVLRREMDGFLYEQMELIRMEKNHYGRGGGDPRVRGYDTCAGEIGCRPEVFALFYRRIQQFAGENQVDWIHWTYHVGEDYLDLVDGLRAVDEVVRFCELPEGSRLGHGMALGIEPGSYYCMRQNRVLLPAQDLLDNIAWTLGFCRENGIVVEETLKKDLEKEFRRLWGMIYQGEAEEPGEKYRWVDTYSVKTETEVKRTTGEETGFFRAWREAAVTRSEMPWDEYYDAWKLRGDSPRLYLESLREMENSADGGSDLRIPRALAGCESDLREAARGAREKENCRWLYLRYHYDVPARERGYRTEIFTFTETYIRLIRRMQGELREKLTAKRIGIECNPSSNYQIGPFERYEEHPMFCMYGKNLNDVPASRMSVSINTDDMGIFQTSLEMEYMTMYMALQKCKTEDGHKRYSREEIIRWLADVKRMGREQSFIKCERLPRG
ncbi:MAG TPA: hypothetical protein DF613_11280 [Lachnospiraceae bacterium]|nr:hypothetical protein [Lachnospiraceae bacterium]